MPKRHLFLAAVLAAVITADPTAGQQASTVVTPASSEHEMVRVPEGPFLMGTNGGERSNENPQHTVFLNAFDIDRYEVTQGQYRACVDAGGCQVPARTSEYRWYEDDAEAYPITGVTWQKADDYCRWAGLRLPTEAEWEKAARGTDGRTYPFGEEIDPSKAHYANSAAISSLPVRVGSFPEGVSPYGVHDMAGNVWEWVADYYREDAYLYNALLNPMWDEPTPQRFVRGGSIHSPAEVVTTSLRMYGSGSDFTPFLGFRCAADAPGEPAYPRLRSAAVRGERLLAAQPGRLEAEVVLDRSLDPSGVLRGFAVDLAPLGIAAQIPFESLGEGRYRATRAVTVQANGLYTLPVYVDADGSERYLCCSIDVPVTATQDVALVRGEAGATDWSATGRRIAELALDQDDQVHTGAGACAFTVASSFSGWGVTFATDTPVHPFGLEWLRLAVHPGDAALQSGDRFNVAVVPGKGVNLLNHVDMTRQEWQVIEIRLADFEASEPITAVSLSGNFAGTWYLDDVSLLAAETRPAITAVSEEHAPALPAQVALAPGYPNPFNSETVLRFELPRRAQVELSVHNLAGQTVATLVRGQRLPGSHRVIWDGRDDAGRHLASGLYLCRLQTAGEVATRKLLLLR